MFRNERVSLIAIFTAATFNFLTVGVHAETQHSARTATEPWVSGGFVIGARMGITPLGGEAFTSKGFSLGYKFGKAIFQVTSAVQYQHTEGFAMRGFTGNVYDVDGWVIVARPELQIAYAQFPHNYAELVGQVGIGLGGQLNSNDSQLYPESGPVPPSSTTYQSLLVDTHVSTGARMWPHPQFGLSIVGGIEFASRIPMYTNGRSQWSFSPRIDLEFLAVF